MTIEKARIELAKLKEAKRTGQGAKTLRERREQQAEEIKVKKQAEAELQKGLVVCNY